MANYFNVFGVLHTMPRKVEHFKMKSGKVGKKCTLQVRCKSQMLREDENSSQITSYAYEIISVTAYNWRCEKIMEWNEGDLVEFHGKVSSRIKQMKRGSTRFNRDTFLEVAHQHNWTLEGQSEEIPVVMSKKAEKRGELPETSIVDYNKLTINYNEEDDELTFEI